MAAENMDEFREKYLKSYVVTVVDDQGEAWTFVLQFDEYPSHATVMKAIEEEQDMSFDREDMTFFPLNDVMPIPPRTYRCCAEIERELEDVTVEHYEFDHKPTKEEILEKIREEYSFDENYGKLTYYEI